MLPIERRQQILTWLEEEETLKVSDISERLGVSEMTVYRDIKPLVDEGSVQKTSNGIASSHELPLNGCSLCMKSIGTRHSVQLVKTSHRVEQTCCPHCGLLRFNDIRDEVVQILCRDFLTDATISAKTATFLIGAELNLNCCQPQVIAFGSLMHAEKFQTGFGGTLYTFEEAIHAISDTMQGHDCCHP
ncbi:DeoR family transcriptional regulator [Rossellomorea marisflavi]|uniref:DeoR family transcriptional regulator n=1 Tax=Rossellomorea marisflavi TaxID=189381 RepID=UPI00279F0950|nr:DeoR family transcriptional regulator [Rossellomorea marisflavi]UTE73114.1 DeoR family transcriptional regulator [Rossellomorea marisflavi]